MKFYEMISSVQTNRKFNGISAIDFRNKYFGMIVKVIISGVK